MEDSTPDQSLRREYFRARYDAQRQIMRELGVPMQDKRGRPRLHATAEDAHAAVLASKRASTKRQRDAVRERIQAALAPDLGSSD